MHQILYSLTRRSQAALLPSLRCVWTAYATEGMCVFIRHLSLQTGVIPVFLVPGTQSVYEHGTPAAAERMNALWRKFPAYRSGPITF